MLGEKLITLRKKNVYSQQEIADMLSVTRQTISNWECGQGAPSLDKAAELAAIYKVSLDDLAGNKIEIAAKEKKEKDLHVLKKMIGKKCILDCSDWDLVLVDEVMSDLTGTVEVKILDVNEEWFKIEYERRKEGTIFRKEKVVKLVDLSLIAGLMLEVTEE